MEFNYSGTEARPEESSTEFSSIATNPSDFAASSSPDDAQSSSSAPLSLPNFGAYSEAYAVAAKLAGRINAASVSEAEHNNLLRERQALLDKKLTKTITRTESNRLEYVRWSLDRIEDAKHGQALDMLDGYVSKYEKFLEEVQNLEEQLSHRTRRGK